jgi:uncharacterized membrane protein YoaK (UPF0700 family)
VTRHEGGQLVLAIGLTTIAGAVDAAGLLQLGHFFVSFMSGNTTQLGVSTGQERWDDSAIAGSLVASFVVGVMLGRLLSRRSGRWCRPVVLAVEAVLLATAALAPLPPSIASCCMAVAMGLQNTVIHRADGTRVRLTYVTGTLVSFGERLTDTLLRTDSALAWVPDLCLWLGFVVGAAAGALLSRRLEISGLIMPALCLAAVSIAMAAALRREAS